jgi:acyl-coenzyme A thioesterase PaaI-like protein
VADVLDDLFRSAVPFVATVGITVMDSQAGRGRAELTNHLAVHNHLGDVHAAAAFTVAETASGAAIVAVLGDRLVGTGDRRPLRAVVADADITYWRRADRAVMATATIDDLPAGRPTVEALVERRNVSVSVELDDGAGQAIGRAAFHWVITE